MTTSPTIADANNEMYPRAPRAATASNKSSLLATLAGRW
jgi:hypothetical protein